MVEGDGESSDMTVVNDEVVPPIVVKDQNTNIKTGNSIHAN